MMIDCHVRRHRSRAQINNHAIGIAQLRHDRQLRDQNRGSQNLCFSSLSFTIQTIFAPQCRVSAQTLYGPIRVFSFEFNAIAIYFRIARIQNTTYRFFDARSV